MFRVISHYLPITATFFFVLFSSIANAENSQFSKQNLPKNDQLRLVVLGDSLADGLYQGITQLNKKRDNIKTSKKSKVNTGLVRRDRYDWNKGAAKISKSGKYDAAFVLLGLNDLQSIREKGKPYHFTMAGWEERYIARIEKMMTDLKSSGMAVYWLGIPVVSTKSYVKEYQYLNTLFKKAAQKTNVRFIDTWSVLANKNGKFTPFYRQANGKKLEIRMRDGVHFTPKGYQIFAQIPNDILQQDLKEAGYSLPNSNAETQ